MKGEYLTLSGQKDFGFENPNLLLAKLKLTPKQIFVILKEL